MEADEGGGAAVACGVVGLTAITVVGATQTDATGPILAFVGAIVVAGLTAHTANKRQRVALAAEAERHRATLDAERKRLDIQLAHERRLVDVAELRRILEGALKVADQISDTTTKVWVGEIPKDEAHAAFTPELANFFESINHLQIRLPDDDPILRAHRGLYETFADLFDMCLADGDAYDHASDRFSAAYRKLVLAAKVRLGSQTG